MLIGALFLHSGTVLPACQRRQTPHEIRRAGEREYDKGERNDALRPVIRLRSEHAQRVQRAVRKNARRGHGAYPPCSRTSVSAARTISSPGNLTPGGILFSPCSFRCVAYVILWMCYFANSKPAADKNRPPVCSLLYQNFFFLQIQRPRTKTAALMTATIR